MIESALPFCSTRFVVFQSRSMRLASFLIVTHAKDHHKFQTSGRIGRENFLQLVHYLVRLHLISELNKSMKVCVCLVVHSGLDMNASKQQMSSKCLCRYSLLCDTFVCIIVWLDRFHNGKSTASRVCSTLSRRSLIKLKGLQGLHPPCPRRLQSKWILCSTECQRCRR